MSILFQARTNEGYVFKILTELLLQNLKTCCLILTEEGMYLNMMNTQGILLINIKIDANNFNLYKFNYKSVKNIGLNLSYLHKMLKTVKKKDCLEFFIKDDNENNFGIVVTPSDNSRITTSFITIHSFQNIDIKSPNIECKPIIISSSEFQKTMKEMNTIGQQIQVKKTLHTISFGCITNGIYSREVTFGNIMDNDGNEEIYYNDKFNTDNFYKLIKISGLSKRLQIYAKKESPLLIVSNIGNIGEIRLLLKSNSQIDI